MSTSNVILQSHLETSISEKTDELRYAKKVDALLKYNKDANAGDVLTPLSYYLGILDNTDKVMFRFMSLEKKNQILRDLQITYLLLLTQKKHELQHQKSENLKSYNKNIKRCEKLIDALNYEQDCKDKEIRPAPEHGCATDGYPVKYLSIFFGQWFALQMVGWMNRKTKTVKEAMGALNEKRLYWVWGSVLLKTVLELMSSDFFNVDQAKQTIRTPDPYTGCLSWSLYYFRFALNLGLLLKHTISGPWMSEEEKSTPWTERFQTQWAQRKFSLLNDSLWATSNMLSFFWLTGKGLLGTFGDALTIVLLVFDISMAVWDFEEQKTKYNKEMLDYETNIKKLRDQIRKPKTDLEKEEAYTLQLKEYQAQLHALERAQTKCKRDWDYQKLSLINNIAYAVGLMLAFVLLTTPFLPITGGALVAIGVAGAALCFAFTVIYNAVKGGMEIHKTKALVKEAKQDYQNKITELKQLLSEHPDLNDNVKKLLFLEIKKLGTETEYQKQMVVLQTMHLIRSIVFEALLPALIFVSLVFLPLNIGFGVLGAVIALAILSNLAINAIFKPEETKLSDEFDEKEYSTFCEGLDIPEKPCAKSLTFFKSPEEQRAIEIAEKCTDDKIKPDVDPSLLDDGLGAPSK